MGLESRPPSKKSAGISAILMRRGDQLHSLAQAVAAQTFCQANGGTAPPGYFVIGDGAIIGLKQ